MKLLALAFFGCVSAFAQPTCSSPTVIVGPTWARIEITASGAWQYSRVQYGTTASYGTIIGVDGAYTGTTVNIGIGTVGGLTPSTAYNAALQLSTDNATWCSAINVPFTTSADTGWSPDAPTPVTHAPRTQPAIVGTAATATTCAQIPSLIAAATPANNTVLITASLSCSTDDFPGNNVTLNATDGARGWWSFSAIDTSTETFTKTAHGLTNGNTIRIAPTNGYGRVSKGLDPTLDYFVVGATANTFQVAATDGGAALDIRDITFSGGTAPEVSYNVGALPAPILILSSRWAELPPLGIPVDLSHAALMPTIRMRTTNTQPVFDFRGRPGPVFIRGLNIVPDAAATAGTPGGLFAGRFVVTSNGQRNFTLAQNIIAMPALYPQRVWPSVIEPNGTDVAVVDNHMQNLAMWRPWNKSVSCTFVGNTLTCSAGEYYQGHQKCVTGVATLVLSAGSSGGPGFIWEDGNCAITMQLPTGYTGTCTNCTLTTAATPAYPVTGGAFTAWPIGDVTVGSVVFTSASTRSQTFPIFGKFDSGAVISWQWAKRLLVEGNSIIDSPGIPIFGNAEHYDHPLGQALVCGPSDCGVIVRPSDVLVRRNRITYSATTIGVDDGSATLLQFNNRNAIESKDCTRCSFEGNFVDGNYKSAENAGPALLCTPVSIDPTFTTRVTCESFAVRGNVIRSAAGMQVSGRLNFPVRVGLLSDRVMVEHNIFHIDKTLVAAHSLSNFNGAFLFSNGPQRVTLRNNTIRGIDNGSGLAIIVTCSPMSLRFTGNVSQMNNTNGGGGIQGQQCAFPGTFLAGNTSDPSAAFGGFIAPNYDFTGNTLVGGVGTDGLTELTSGQVTTLAARHLAATWPAGASVAARLTAANMQPDWQRTITQAAGADERIIAGFRGIILGDVQARAASATSITAWWYAPDVTGCWVDRSTNGGTTWNAPTQATATERRQSITFTGLTTGAYVVRVRCAGSSGTARAIL